jgi:hypothetical protein
MQTYQRHTLPCFSCRSNNTIRHIRREQILNHFFLLEQIYFYFLYYIINKNILFIF